MGNGQAHARIKWLAYVAVAGILFLVIGEIVSSATGCEVACGNTVFGILFVGITLGVPASVGAARKWAQVVPEPVQDAAELHDLFGALPGELRARERAIRSARRRNTPPRSGR